MKIFSAIFSICFLILGGILWIVALAIIVVGALGILRVTIRQVFEVDVIEWYASYKAKKGDGNVYKQKPEE